MMAKIACVDDEKSIHEMIRTILVPPSKGEPVDLFDPPKPKMEEDEAGSKYNLNFFDNGISARQALEDAYSQKVPFHLLIVDLRMPERDGLWLIEQARNIDPRIRIIVFTALSEVTLDTIGEKAGNPNFMYLEKSANPLVLIQAVENEIANWISFHDNRRFHQRLPLENRVTFTIPGKMEGRVIDISSEGIGILDLPMEIAVGKKVDFTFEAQQKTFAGKVKWVRREGSRFRLGIQFPKGHAQRIQSQQQTDPGGFKPAFNASHFKQPFPGRSNTEVE